MRFNPIISRRAFCLGTTALTLPRPLLAQSSLPTLTAREGTAQLAPADYPATNVWGFEGQVPGPVLRFPQGARLERRLVNELLQPTSIHWHGIRIANAMDGVAGLTQAAIQPGESFDYSFTLPDAGTYWYHSHNRSFEQVARGLYGPLIIDEPEAPDLDADEIFLLDDWRLDPETAQITDDFGNFHDLSHAGRLGNLITTNGAFDATRTASQHDRLRIRLINASNARVMTLSLSGLEGWIMALDGMPLETPQPADGELVLAPAQRMDLFVDVTAENGSEAFIAHRAPQGEWWAQVTWNVGAGSNARRPPPAPLPPNPMQDVPGHETARRFTLTMEGGAMGGMGSANYQGQTLSARDLAQSGQFWAFNSIVGRTEEPFLTAQNGETIRILFRNETAFPHGMHLHGMHFREVLSDNSLGPMRDTLLLQRGEAREVAFVAHNPGAWLLHCHMLGHAASGMNSWIEVSA